MIVISIGDGLGNQMFQYAFYYAMKKHYGRNRVLLDNEFYGSVNEHNGIELEKVFNIKLPLCPKKQAMILADYNGNLKKKHPIINCFWAVRSIIFGRKESYILEDYATNFYEHVFGLNPLKSYYLRGNWINEKYFKNYRDEIIQEFSFVEIGDDKNRLVAEEIQKSYSVSAHVRAGDYLNNGIYAQLTKDYYKEALKIIREKTKKDIKLFVFSDNRRYAEKIFSDIEDKVVVDFNSGEDSYKDMQLMSMCKHNIIANSTFGFWGAYLNKNKEKIVIAPKSVFSEGSAAYTCEDWIVI